MSSRREYSVNIQVNRLHINRVIVDPHYESKHKETINDEIVLALVKTLDGKNMVPEKQTEFFSYFVTDYMSLNGQNYKLIWLLEKNDNYLGVINAYRR